MLFPHPPAAHRGEAERAALTDISISSYLLNRRLDLSRRQAISAATTRPPSSWCSPRSTSSCTAQRRVPRAHHDRGASGRRRGAHRPL